MLRPTLIHCSLFALALSTACSSSISPIVPPDASGDAQVLPDTQTLPDVPVTTDVPVAIDVRPVLDAPRPTSDVPGPSTDGGASCALPDGGTCAHNTSCAVSRCPDGTPISCFCINGEIGRCTGACPPPPSDGGAPVPCPGTVSGTGLMCESPGTGCGTAGPGCTVNCNCGSDLRWVCTGSGAGCDVDAGTPPPPTDGGTCAITGRWNLGVEGASLFFSFTAAGLWGGSMDASTVDTAPNVGGTYTFVSNRLTLREGRGMPTGCDPTSEGVYDATFNATCTSFTLSQVTKGCAARGETLNGATFTR